ncbi:SLC13 family permease [Paeniglutamicibacter cryotolerans]|uniref:Na+/H+ antiporter NhaD/arsenite permease-like protein n=1 Tax=Paeniglutamicibacter cryotolerans TaxID=670079 RepID=A0A839QQS9_9MICC|nr:SLC13 family permease [Paeniglutamicibacter cryotolerans]MBB2995612.1 Na+/H+ antiporter NhaD/arsenite permease-like protein [Paeniglutamicibacter cryotolerans]
MRLAGIGMLGLAAGGMAAAVGVLPTAELAALGLRIGPIMLFLASISVVVNLSARAGVFAALAALATQAAGGRTWLLWTWQILLAILCTAFLSLDTTAVLLTPLVLAVVRTAGLRPLAFAVPIIWLANTASLFLPVSNVTNLLAVEGGTLGTPAEFLIGMFLPGAAAVAATVLVSVLVFRRQLQGRHRVSSGGDGPETCGDRMPFRASVMVLVMILPLLLSAIPYWITTTAGAAVLLAVFALRERAAVRLSLVPWNILLFAIGLMVAASVLSALPLAGLLPRPGPGLGGMLALAASGAVGSNLINNLPAYLVFEPLAGSPELLRALLIGVNAGPLATPWASLATLLWHDQLRRGGVEVSWLTFCLWGLLLAPLAVAAAVLTSHLTGG